MDPYQILQIPAEASIEEIKKAYYKLAKKWHPDRNRTDSSAKERFQEIQEAYEILIRPKKSTTTTTTTSPPTTSSSTSFSSSKVPSWEEVEQIFRNFCNVPRSTYQRYRRDANRTHQAPQQRLQRGIICFAVFPDGHYETHYADIMEGLQPILGGPSKMVSQNPQQRGQVIKQGLEFYILKDFHGKASNPVFKLLSYALFCPLESVSGPGVITGVNGTSLSSITLGSLENMSSASDLMKSNVDDGNTSILERTLETIRCASRKRKTPEKCS